MTNRELILRVHEEIWTRGNADAIESLYAPGFVAHYPGPLGWSGIEGTREAFRVLRSAFPDWTETVEDIVAEGDRVVTRFRSSGTHRGEFLGIAPTGKTVEMTEMALFRIENGKVAEQWGNHDLLGLLTQLGAVPSIGG